MRRQRATLTRTRARSGARIGAAAGAALLAGSLLAACGSDSEASDDSSAAGADPPAVVAADLDPVADWLSGEVTDQGFVDGQYIDHGLSLDVATALDDIGGHDEVVERILDAMQDPQEVLGYVSFYDEKKNGQYAGATAKLVYTVVTHDRRVADYRVDLLDDLVAMIATDGPQAGRAMDTGATDYSNSISQAFVVRALAVTDRDERLAPSLGFLLDQQCGDGWFRESLEADKGQANTCEKGTEGARKPSVDATAHAVIALTEVREDLTEEDGTAADQAVEDAVGWLESVQGDDGGFSVAGEGQESPNANSTGLAAAALDAAGSTDASDQAATWLLEHVVTEDTGGKLSDEVGVVAFDGKALELARRTGIKPADRYRWQRATVEAAQGMQSVAEQ